MWNRHLTELELLLFAGTRLGVYFVTFCLEALGDNRTVLCLSHFGFRTRLLIFRNFVYFATGGYVNGVIFKFLQSELTRWQTREFVG
jgi:hypothetical protein